MKTRQDYKNAALASLEGRWKPAVLATLLLYVLAAAASLIQGNGHSVIRDIIAIAAYLCVFAAEVGYMNGIKAFIRKEEEEVINPVIADTRANFVRYMLGYLLMTVLVFLWTLLLIVPGIIKSLAYSMAPYILKEDPEIGYMDALRKSEAMMQCHKMELFVLYLSFIGWILLGCITFGIGMLWVSPYIYGTVGLYYEDLKAENAPAAVSE